jgi:hypothetical protein
VSFVAKAVFTACALCDGDKVIVATCFFYVEEVSASFASAYTLGKYALIFETLSAAAKAATVTATTIIAATESAAITTAIAAAAITTTITAATESTAAAITAVSPVGASEATTITTTAVPATIATAFAEATTVATIAASVAVVTVPIVIVSPLKIPVFHLSESLVKKIFKYKVILLCTKCYSGYGAKVDFTLK